MELAPAGVPLSFEVTFDSPTLHVGMSVYDDSGALPVLLLSPFAMARVAPGLNTYRGKFTAQAGKNYIILKAVYTDDTLTTLDGDYSQGSESIVAQYLNGTPDGGGCPVVGIVDETDAVIGVVDC